MKKSMIREIFFGRRGNANNFNLTERESELLDIEGKIAEDLEEKLTPEQWELHEKFANAIRNELCEEITQHYIEGFKVGLLLGIECMEE